MAKKNKKSKLKLGVNKKLLFTMLGLFVVAILIYFFGNIWFSADSNSPSLGSVVKTQGPDNLCSEMKGYTCTMHQAVGSGDGSSSKTSSYYVVGIAMPGIKNQAQKDAINKSYATISDMKSTLSKYGLSDISVAKCSKNGKTVSCQQYWSMSNRFYWGVPAKADTTPSQAERNAIMEKQGANSYTSDTNYWVGNNGAEHLNIYFMPRSKSTRTSGLMGYIKIYNATSSVSEGNDSTTEIATSNSTSTIDSTSSSSTDTASSSNSKSSIFGSLSICSSKTYNKSVTAMDNKLELKGKIIDQNGDPIAAEMKVTMTGDKCTTASGKSNGKCSTYKNSDKSKPVITINSDSNGEFTIPFNIVKMTVEKRKWNCKKSTEDKYYVGTLVNDKDLVQLKNINIAVNGMKKTVSFKYPLKATAKNIDSYSLPQITWKTKK